MRQELIDTATTTTIMFLCIDQAKKKNQTEPTECCPTDNHQQYVEFSFNNMEQCPGISKKSRKEANKNDQVPDNNVTSSQMKLHVTFSIYPSMQPSISSFHP